MVLRSTKCKPLCCAKPRGLLQAQLGLGEGSQKHLSGGELQKRQRSETEVQAL